MVADYTPYFTAGVDIPGRRKSTWDETVAPGVNDDETRGFAPGSMWLDQVAQKLYVCSDASMGAATWIALN